MLHLWIVSGCIGAGKSAGLRALEALPPPLVSPNPSIVHIFKEGQDKWLYWLERCRRNPRDQESRLMLQLEVVAHYQHVTTKICSMADRTPRNVELHVFVERSPEDVLRLFVEPFEAGFEPEQYRLMADLLRLYCRQHPWSEAKRLYIDTPPCVCVERIRRRGRLAERDLTEDYIVEQARIHEERLGCHERVHAVNKTPRDVALNLMLFAGGAAK